MKLHKSRFRDFVKIHLENNNLSIENLETWRKQFNMNADLFLEMILRLKVEPINQF